MISNCGIGRRRIYSSTSSKASRSFESGGEISLRASGLSSLADLMVCDLKWQAKLGDHTDMLFGFPATDDRKLSLRGIRRS